LYIPESVLSDISYSRVEDSLDSDKNFEDAMDRWEPEVFDTVKRKRTSGLSNPNGMRKEIEVKSILCYLVNILFYELSIYKPYAWFTDYYNYLVNSNSCNHYCYNAAIHKKHQCKICY